MTRLTGPAVAAAVLLGACGPDGGGKITGMIDSCATLRAVDAPGLIGVAFDPPESLRDMDAGANTGRMSACGQTSTASGAEIDGAADLRAQLRNTWVITLMAWTWPNVESAKAYMDSMRLGEPGQTEPVEVNGLGDDAVWSGTMHVRKGNVTLSMDVRGPAESQGEKSEMTLETELAGRAIDHLK